MASAYKIERSVYGSLIDQGRCKGQIGIQMNTPVISEPKRPILIGEKHLSRLASTTGVSAMAGMHILMPDRHRNHVRVSSGQSLITPHIEGFPFEKRMALYAPLEGCVGSQNGRVDHPSVQKQIQERPLGVRKGQNRG